MTRVWDIVETNAIEKRKTKEGVKYVNNYALLQILGHGRYAKVKLCERMSIAKDGSTRRRQFAVKIFSKLNLRKIKEYVSVNDDSTFESTGTMQIRTALDQVREEIRIMRSLYHRNIVLLFEVMEMENSDKIYLIMEYMTQGPCMIYRSDTKDFVSPITQSVLPSTLARTHLLDVLHGLKYLHERGICHRDLKPDNILLNADGRCHLADFGCAMQRQQSDTPVHVTDTTGTYHFLAPECCSGEPYDPFKVDIWAVGVLLYIFLFGTLPFNCDGTKELFDTIIQCDLVLPIEESERLPSDCKDLLLRLLDKSPSERILLKDALQHPWLVGNAQENENEA